MKSKEYISFKKMIEYIDKSLKYTEGYTFKQFCEDEKTIDATLFNISQIGELVKNITKETMEQYSNIEWNMIKGLRNRIVHDYEGISLKSIWYVLQNDVIELKDNIQKIIINEDNKKNDMYYDENIKIEFLIPKYLQENIDNLIQARKEERLDVDCEEEELISNINRAYYSKDITEDQAKILRKKYLWWN